jgi:hypothetical protein
MQPYFLPYVGYFQLISSVDQFVIYDNIKYTKKGWINRNRFLQNNRAAIFTLPLENDSDSKNICQRSLATDFNKTKILNMLTDSYRKSRYFDQTFPLIQRIIQFPERNLFLYLQNSISLICDHLSIDTKILVSSKIAIDHQLRSQEKVIALCGALGATNYVNAINGLSLYSKNEFEVFNIDLSFIESLPFEYPQNGGLFVPHLSIMDVLMFNDLEIVKEQINSGYTFV